MTWTLKVHKENIWPRCDYKELLELSIIMLGGQLPNFTLKFPGPDHHARWMSKAIYLLKIHLLFNVFTVSQEERKKVVDMCEFILIIYIKPWFRSPLAISAASTDIRFMSHLMKYRLRRPVLSWNLLQSARNHMWYLTPQLVILALVDSALEDVERESMARALHACPRLDVACGKLMFPELDWSDGVDRPDLSSLISSDSWLVFDILKAVGSQDWLLLSCKQWEIFEVYRSLKEFVSNLVICNDLAERGIQLISRFISQTESEKQRQALLQVVEYHRDVVPTS